MEAQKTLKARRACDKDQLMDFYNSWAEKYQEDLDTLGYQGPKVVADLVSSHFRGSRAEAQVLDIACGSGEFAKLMKERGFRMFSGVDYSEGMLKEAEKTGLYQKLKQANLGTDPLPGNADTYDVAVIIGALNTNLVPWSVLREICKVTKPGGLICLTKTIYESEEQELVPALEKELQLMEDDGLWTKVEFVKYVRYLKKPLGEEGENRQEDGDFFAGHLYLFQK